MKIVKLTLSILGLAVLLILPFAMRPYIITGNSMETTLKSGEVILVDVFSTKVFPPRRGELLVFRNPHRKSEGDYIEMDVKRVIGLPGETVHVRRDKVIIDETTYAASTMIGGGTTGDNGNEFDMFLGPHDYFVLGDNRGDSSDSRYFGAVQEENFIGRVILKL